MACNCGGSKPQTTKPNQVNPKPQVYTGQNR